MMQDPTSTNIDYSASYTPKNEVNISNFESLGDAGNFNAANLMDASTADLIKRSVTQSMQNPGIEPLPIEQYYPGIDRPLQVGQFSGPMGGIPLFAAGVGYEPVGVLEAKNLARQKIQDEYQQKALKALSYDYPKTKDALRQNAVIGLTDKVYGDIYNQYVQKYGTLAGAQMASNSQEFKKAQATLNNYVQNLDEMFDAATTTHMQFQKNKMGGGTTTKKVLQSDGSYTVEKTGAGDIPYVSPYTEQLALDYLSLVTRDPKEMKLEDIENYNPKTKFMVSKSLDEVIDNSMNSLIKPDLTTSIYNEAKAGNIGVDKNGNPMVNGKLGTDKTSIAYVVERSGFSDDRIKEIAHANWKTAYDQFVDLYGEEGAKKYVPPEEDVYEGLKGYIYDQAKITINEAAKSGVEEVARAKKINQELLKSVPMQTVQDYRGKKANEWDINNAQIQVTGSTLENTQFTDASGNPVDKAQLYAKWGLKPDAYQVVKLKQGEPSATGKASARAIIVPYEKQLTATVDQSGKPVYTYQSVPNYQKQIEVNYSDVKSQVEQVYSGKGGQPSLENWNYETLEPAAEGGTAPTIGTIESGYRFKGGDPSKQENWEPVK